MDNPTDAAVETLAEEFHQVYNQTVGDSFVAMKAIARHLLTRQPGPEDVERIRIAVLGPIASGHPAERLCVDIADDCARAILALYPALPEDARACIGRLTLRVNELRAELVELENTPVRAPTRSALDSALDPMLGNTPVRKAVVDMVLGLFENARRPLTEADVERITKSATNIRAARDGDYRMWADLSNYVHAERAQFTRDILAAASCPTEKPTNSAASDRLAWIEKAHSETMDQSAYLIVEKDALNARVADLETELAAAKSTDIEEERRVSQLIDERDIAEEALSQAFYLVTGRSPEWSSMWGRQDALEEIGDACALLRESAATTPPPGTIRLGEGLTEAQEANWTIDEKTKHSERMESASAALTDVEWWRFGYVPDCIKVAEVWLTRMAAALRASAAAKPEAVDWVKIAKDRSHTSEERYSNAEVITGLCEQIAALRAGGV